jgi:crotonobetainyl-CoA:carnitine CoA-transferase CaiB-like acyl-CoA transferase
MGADTVNIVPRGHNRSADDRCVAIACSSDGMFERLAATMGRPELAQDSRYKTMLERDKRRNELNKMVADWVGSLAARDVLDLCEENEMACGLLYDIEDIFNDRHYQERGNIKPPRMRALCGLAEGEYAVCCVSIGTVKQCK